MANRGAYIEIDGEKQFISRELRFLHHSEPFNTREEAKAYVDEQIAADNINNDYAQPVVVRYIDEGGENIILGIGKGDNGYHFIDSAALEHDIKAIIASIGTGDEGEELVYDDKKLLSVKDRLEEINLTIQNGDEEVSFDPDHTIAAKIDEILSFINNATSSIGLKQDGTISEYASSEYISDGQNLKEAIETLDGGLADVQKQITGNKISSSDKSITVIESEDGTDISANIDDKTIVIDNDGTILSKLWIKKYDEGDNIDHNLLAVYRLVDKDGSPIEGSRDIEVPRDRNLYDVHLGDMGDVFNRPYEGNRYKTLFPDDIKSGTSEDEALRFIYQLSDGVFQMVLVSLETFLHEAEFKDGLKVVNHEVSVKLDTTPNSDSERFLDFVDVPGENASIGLHGITDAIQVETDRATAQEDKIEASVGLAEDGSHIETNGHYTSGASTIAEEIAKLDEEAYRNSGETDSIETGVGLDEDGNYIKTEDRFTSGATSVVEAIKALNDNSSDIQDELDRVEESVGLNEDGSYNPTTGDYTSGATTVKESIEMLDFQAKRNHVETKIIEGAVGLDNDGAYIKKTGTHYLNNATSIESEISALDAEAFRNSGETNTIEASVGLNENGEYVPYMGGSYISGATTVLEATSMLDDAIKDIQGEIVSNKVYGEDAIKTRTEATGTTISLKVGDGDKLLTNDENGLHTTIDLVEVEGEELKNLGNNVREAYKLTGVGDTQIGQYIKIYRDSVIYKIALGDMGDKFTNFEPASAGMITTNPAEENITKGTTGEEAIRVIYDLGRVNDEGNELYEMVLINLDSFLQVDEFKDGLEVVDGDTSKVVKVKIDSESEGFLSVSTNGVKLSGIQDAINVERDRATAQEDKIEASVGLAGDGTHITTTGHYTSSATTIAGEIEALDTEAYRNANEHTTIKNAVGLDDGGHYIRTTDRFTSAATNVMEAITLAVRQIDANEINISAIRSNIIKNKVHSGSNAITVEETGTEEAGTKVGLWINSSDNVLTQDNGLLATIHLTKATGITTAGTAYNCIRLIGRNNIILDEINTDDFVKDGFLDNVEIITRSGKNYLVFTWNTDSGKVTTEIDATELVKPYTASSGVTLDSNNNFSGVVDPTSDSYFTVGADGFKLTGVRNAIDTVNSLISQLRSEFDAERIRSIAKDGEQDMRLYNLENNVTTIKERVDDLEDEIEDISHDTNEKLVDLFTDNGGIEIENADEGAKKYRRLKLKIGSELDTTESQLPSINYLRIVTERDPGTGKYTERSGLHTTIRPITETELNEIMNLNNIQ